MDVGRGDSRTLYGVTTTQSAISAFAETSPESQQLLDSFVTTNNQQAFAELVGKYVDFVHGTACRSLGGDRAQADDVTQAVFVIFSKKAQTIRSASAIGSWLHQTTLYACSNARKINARRQHHEQQAANTKPEAAMPDDNLESLSPFLDQAISTLNSTDKAAIIGRYFQGTTTEQLARDLNSNPEAIQKRLERAIEKMRNYFSKNKLTASAVGVTALLSASSAHAAPATLTSTIVSTTFTTAATGSTVAAITKGTLTMMNWIKIKLTLTICMSLMLLASAGLTLAQVTASQIAPTKLIGEFSDGLKVEVISVSEGNSQWSPNGAPLSEPTYDLDPENNGKKVILTELGIQITATNGKRWNATNLQWSGSHLSLGLTSMKREKIIVENAFRFVGGNFKREKTTSLVMRFADQPATDHTILTLGQDQIISDTIPDLGYVELSNPHEVDGKAAIDAMIPNAPEGIEVVVIAKPKQRGFILAEGGTAIGGTNNNVKTILYQQPLANVAGFYIRTRRYDRKVEFQNISLLPGNETKPSAIVTEKLIQSTTTKPAGDDLKLLLGDWDVVAIGKGGKLAPAEQMKDAKFNFTGTLMSINIGGETKEAGNYVIDPTTSPKQFDLRDKDNPDRLIPGIYELNGDSLKISCDPRTAKRPAAMPEDPSKTTGVMYILKRAVKPIDADAKMQSMKNLRQIGLGINMYAQDNRGALPGSLVDLTKTRRPYVNAEILLSPFSDPKTPLIYIYLGDNQISTGRLGKLAPTTIICYDKPNNPEVGSPAVFMDGHVEWLIGEELNKQLEQSKKNLDEARKK